MAQKKLQKGSEYEKYDLDGDGIVSDEELAMEERMIDLENRDKKEDAQRTMAWYALGGMLLYPVCVILAVVFNIEQAAKILGDMAGVYFIAVAGIVAAFFGAQAIAKAPPKK
jgi:hypothetical protein|tara:strand:- start:254 stop:589 length:336 start_codon:yes stop_codon:yes gene_type:complete